MKTINYQELTSQIDNMILCNEISNKDLELYSGNESYCYYDEQEYNNNDDLKESYKTYQELLESGEYEEHYEIFQWFIIDKESADYLSKYTNELIYYNEELDLYILAVTHWGTPWDGVNVEVKNDFIIRK